MTVPLKPSVLRAGIPRASVKEAVRSEIKIHQQDEETSGLKKEGVEIRTDDEDGRES